MGKEATQKKLSKKNNESDLKKMKDSGHKSKKDSARKDSSRKSQKDGSVQFELNRNDTNIYA